MVYILVIQEFYHSKLVYTRLDKVFVNENDIWNYIEKQYYSFVKMINEEGWGINRVIINSTGVSILYNAFDGGSESMLYEIYKRTPETENLIKNDNNEQTDRNKIQLHTCTGKECSAFDHAWCNPISALDCPYVKTYDIENVEFILEEQDENIS